VLTVNGGGTFETDSAVMSLVSVCSAKNGAVGGQGKDLNTLSCWQVDGRQGCPLDRRLAPREQATGSQ
jgi:hypothetical protein